MVDHASLTGNRLPVLGTDRMRTPMTLPLALMRRASVRLTTIYSDSVRLVGGPVDTAPRRGDPAGPGCGGGSGTGGGSSDAPRVGVRPAINAMPAVRK